MTKRKTLLMALLSMMIAIPNVLLAADCKTILAKLPVHSPEANEQAKMVQDFENQCKQRSESDPKALTECLTVGMRAMAVAGNFVAAEKMAQMECAAGNDKISKTWMGMVVNNQNATQADKDVAQEAINSNENN